MQRGRWSPAQRDALIQQIARRDGYQTEIVIEQEPGSAGKSVTSYLCGALAGYTVHADRPSGPKHIRAQPFAAQCEAGNVCLLSGKWNNSYLDELCMFPNATYDDQVDASAGAFNRLTQYAVAYEAPKVLRVEPCSLRRFGIQFDPGSRLFRR